MAAVERGWAKTLAVAVLLIVAGALSLAQTSRTQSVEDGSTGSLSGKLTDLHSNPLGGVALILRNQATGFEERAITSQNGAYRFSGLEPGEYALTAESPQLGRGEVEAIVVAAGHEAHVQAAMELNPLSSSSVLAASPGARRHDLEPAALLAGDTALATEPMRLLPLSGQRLADLLGYAPRTETLAVNRTLAAEPLWRLPLRGQSAEGAAGQAPAVSVPANAALAHPRENGSPGSEAGSTSASPGQTARGPVGATEEESSPATQALTTTISAAELQALPVIGRHWQDFVLDNAPASVTSAGGQGQIRLRGAGQQPAGIAVDGMDTRLAFGSTSGPSGRSSGRGALGQGVVDPAGIARVGMGGHGLALNEAAIRSVQTAADRAAGGRMDVETSGGGNELHGQGFFFDRQNNWGAQNPFSQWIKEIAPATEIAPPVFAPESYTPADHETTWGIGAGSRILRNRLFWFAALDGSRRNDPGLSTVKNPGAFFGPQKDSSIEMLTTRAGISSNNPLAVGMAEYSCMLETLGGTLGGSSSDCLLGTPVSPLLGLSARTASQWTGFARIDWNATERQSFTLEGIGARWNAPGGGLTRVSETYGNRSYGSTKASEEWLLGRWEAFLTPNLLATTQASAGRAIQTALPEPPSPFEQTFLAGNAWGQLPQIAVDNRYGFTIGNPSRFGQGSYPDEHLYQGQESVDWIRGKLLVKAGFQLSHNADATSLLRNQTGTYTYENAINFTSDVWAFQHGVSELNAYDQHNCDSTGAGLGNLPCYSYFSQTIGPAGWRLSTNDWAGYATAQWQHGKQLVFSAGLRWEREQLPPPFAALRNPELPLTEKLPSLGNNWGPRASLALGSGNRRWPVLRLGYGMYFGRTENAAVETALTQTGSLSGDLNFFMRPTDDLPNNGGGAPPFPHVLAGEPGTVVKPGAVEFAPYFRNPEVHQAVAAVEQWLPSHVEVTASAMLSLGRRLPISIDTNFDPAFNPGTITYAVKDATGAGPLKVAQIKVPFYASWPSPTGLTGRLNPDYQQITQIMSRANSTYESWMLRVVRYGPHGLTVRAHYTYAHAMDWNPNESGQVAGSDVLDPADFSQEYGTSNLDVRHSAGITAVYQAPWRLHGLGGKLGNGWMVSGVGHFRGGLPYTMRTSGSLPEELTIAGTAIVGLGPSMNGSGGDNRVYGIGRNTYRYPATWKADMRLGRRFSLGHMRQLELLAESFNLFNHQNVTELETTGYYTESGSAFSLPTLNFLTGPLLRADGTILKPNSTAFGQPLNINATNFYRERQIQFGLRLRF